MLSSVRLFNPAVLREIIGSKLVFVRSCPVSFRLGQLQNSDKIIVSMDSIMSVAHRDAVDTFPDLAVR